ncbi:MAG: PIG-L deacetylase family protein, partial [Armatimonadota bacterium]
GIALGAIVAGAALTVLAYTRRVPVSSGSPAPDNPELVREVLSSKTVLFVGAHPDDIEFYCGALVHSLLKRGARVTFAIGTRGGKGRQGAAKRRLEGLRTRHQLDSARILGGAEVVLYDYPDKDLPNHVGEFADDLKGLIGKLKPDIVVSWDPDYIYNPHLDHQAGAKAARVAVEASGAKALYYGTREPDLWFGFDEETFRMKLRSIRAHRTEVPWFLYPLARRFLIRKDTAEGAKTGYKYAEVYRRAAW